MTIDGLGSSLVRRMQGVVTVAAIAVAGAGCQEKTTDQVPPRRKAESPVTSYDYVLRGVVGSVVPEAGRVVIRHERIPGFMPAMTMPFNVEDESILGLLQPGDEVEGVLHVEKRDGAVRNYQLRQLKRTKSAPPPSGSQRPTSTASRFELHPPPPILKVGERVPDFAMTDQAGKALRLSELRGKVVVLTFIYTRCPLPDFCPAMDRRFSDLAQKVSLFPERAKAIRLLSVSFDPEHDTPAILAKHAEMRGARPPLWTYAVASHEELAKVAPRLGLLFGANGQEILHTLCTAVVGPDGRLARLEVGREANAWESGDLLRTVYGQLPR